MLLKNTTCTKTRRVNISVSVWNGSKTISVYLKSCVHLQGSVLIRRLFKFSKLLPLGYLGIRKDQSKRKGVDSRCVILCEYL